MHKRSTKLVSKKPSDKLYQLILAVQSESRLDRLTQTATHLSLLRGSAGCAAFPNVGPSGGSLLGLNVIVSSAAQVDSGTNRIALLSPAEIYWTGEGMVQLRVSQAAALEMTDPVTGDPAELVSMWQTNSTAVRAIHEAAWYARPNSQAFVTVPY